MLTALFFSAFIYMEHFELTNKLLATLFGLSALALFLYIPKRALFIAGFLIGIFWFYWIGYSFEYTGMGVITPLVTLGFGLVYMLFFATLAFFTHPALRALMLFGLSFIEPFYFNWMQIELIFVESYIGIEKYHFAIVLLALALPTYMPKKFRFLPLLLLVFALNFQTYEPKLAPLKIKLVATDIKQEKKWLRESLEPTVAMIFRTIHEAIENHYDVVVLPESVFPLFLNKNPLLIEELKKLSFEISIVVGALLRENGENYNVSYIFEAGEYTIAKKLVLVPFGEYVPLPKFAQDFVNEIFFEGQADFSIAEAPTDFTIKGVSFRNAICYEATSQKIYADNPSYLIAISNNAWFAPSIEPTLQNLLMRYYARKNSAIIYHSANFKGTGIVW
jgi:apolipoprotein N-acyltransferase